MAAPLCAVETTGATDALEVVLGATDEVSDEALEEILAIDVVADEGFGAAVEILEAGLTELLIEDSEATALEDVLTVDAAV